MTPAKIKFVPRKRDSLLFQQNVKEVPVNDKLHLYHTKIVFLYKGWFEKDNLHNFFIELFGVETCLISHEEPSVMAPFKHTMILIITTTEGRKNIRGIEAFNFSNGEDGDIYPENIYIVNKGDAVGKVMEYMSECDIDNFDTKEALKKKKQKNPEDNFVITKETVMAIMNAPSLFEAMQIAGIMPKTMHDIKLLRDDQDKQREKAKKNRVCKSLYKVSQFNKPLFEDFKCIFLGGLSGTGKTQFSLAHFKNPLLVSNWDDLRKFDPDFNDGIVLDDIDLSRLTKSELINLTDWEVDRTIKCRYSNAEIPAKTRKIFTSNYVFSSAINPELAVEKAITRRFSHMEWIREPLFNVPEESND